MQDLPYMGGYPQRVVGESSTQPTLFGIIGMFKGDQKYQGLQQVVERPSEGKLPPLYSGHDHETDRGISGHSAKTHIPGIHYGMVPFAGAFMSAHGEIEIYGREHHHSKEHHKEHHSHHSKKSKEDHSDSEEEKKHHTGHSKHHTK